MNKTETKNSEQLQIKVSTCTGPCALQEISQESEKIRDDHTTSQHRPTMSTSHKRQRTTKERRRKRTGTDTAEKTSSKPTDGTTGLSKVRIRRFATKRPVLTETISRCKDLQLRARWIPGGHLRFHVLNSSAKCRSLTSKKQKLFSKMASWRNHWVFSASLSSNATPS